MSEDWLGEYRLATRVDESDRFASAEKLWRGAVAADRREAKLVHRQRAAFWLAYFSVLTALVVGICVAHFWR